jgi:plasmid stability protein
MGATLNDNSTRSLAMSNLTISLDDELIKQARIRVAQQGTSLSAKVRELLQHYVNGTDDATKRLREEATAKLMMAIEHATMATQAPAPSSKPVAKATLREELYADDFRAKDRIANGPGTTAPQQDAQ